MELNETINLMKSHDYKERFKGEYYQAKIRYEKLDNMLSKLLEDKLEFEPACSRALLVKQLFILENYIKILETRAKLEHIKLEQF